jgi:hypothetical protein
MSCKVAGKIHSNNPARPPAVAPRSMHLHAHDCSHFLCAPKLAAGMVFDPASRLAICNFGDSLATTAVSFWPGGPLRKLGLRPPVGITSPGEQSISRPSAPLTSTESATSDYTVPGCNLTSTPTNASSKPLGRAFTLTPWTKSCRKNPQSCR